MRLWKPRRDKRRMKRGEGKGRERGGSESIYTPTPHHTPTPTTHNLPHVLPSAN